MNDAVFTSLTVSAIAISVIFLVLTILIFTIKLLVHFIPYKAPPAKPKPVAKPQTTPAATSNALDADEDVAVITSVMATHLGRSPGNLQVVDIRSR